MDINYSERLISIYNLAAESGADAALISGAANLYYACGFRSSFAYLLVSPEIVLMTDSRYIESARARLAAIPGVQSSDNQTGSDNLTAAVQEEVERLNIRALAFVGDDMSYTLYKSLASGLSCELVDMGDALTALRAKKTDWEIASIREAARIADDAFSVILERLKPGVTEKEIAARLKYIFDCKADGISFEPVVAFGENSSMPHHHSGETQLKERDIILLDFGCKQDGYCSDMTRTVFMGQPDDEALKVYAVVREAQERAIGAITPGAKCADVDAAARGHIAASGYGDCFGHGLGHGVGVDIHEYPVLNERSRHVLEAGMAVTVEPGIYLPGRFGIRIEDLCIVGERAENVTRSSKDIIVLNK